MPVGVEHAGAVILNPIFQQLNITLMPVGVEHNSPSPFGNGFFL
ncbi:hypothetical protein LEP1GSC079_2389 [Leptospira interrogans str. FPW1039]|uniref:Uncharacterized protein n=1 Tax=Leptospira interrogans str. FPW1039 TaxID=1193040 RepID=A0A0F6IDH7_LEPIR|nr:hypothetical protein LEP1GSC079_2389 [Leptospira interrogans str. FPW1039]